MFGSWIDKLKGKKSAAPRLKRRAPRSQSPDPTAPRVVADPAIEKTDRGLRFKLHDVAPAETAPTTIRADRALTALMDGRPESCSDYHRQVLVDIHAQPLILGAYTAYAEHRPLILTPDAVWVTILQGFAHHINAEPERYRDRLVSHQGKKRIAIEVRDHVPGSPENDWPAVFASFCQAVSDDARGELEAWATEPFSTTGPVERAAFRVALLDALQPYYNYVMMCVCGIPSVELTGTSEDWQAIEERIAFLDDFDLNWWTRALKPIAARFTAASKGDIELAEWSRIIKREQAYGGPLLDGWLLELIPYLKGPKDRIDWRNSMLDDPEEQAGSSPAYRLPIPPGVSPKSLPKGLSQVPFILQGGGRTRAMEMIAGLTGVSADDGALEPRIGWAVRPRPDLTAALDILEGRGDLRPKPKKAGAGPALSSRVAELTEIDERGDGGALRTRSGEEVGRLFGRAERSWVVLEGASYSLKKAGKRGRPPGGQWLCFAELDGQLLAFEPDRIRSGAAAPVSSFSKGGLLKAMTCQTLDRPAGELILEALERP